LIDGEHRPAPRQVKEIAAGEEEARRPQNVSENSVRVVSSSSSLVVVLEMPRKTEDEGRRARTSTRQPHIFQTRS